MNTIKEYFREAINDPGRRFVFPSMVAADFWSRYIVEHCGIEAVARQRFLSWDEFKERFTSAKRREKPANLLVRTIFCAGEVAVNAQSPYLTTLINPEYRTQAQNFVSFLRQALPKLRMVVRPGPAFGEGILSDYQALYVRYQTFLGNNGYFEPAYEDPACVGLDGRYAILFPDVIEDFADYQDILAARPDVSLMRFPGTGDRIRLRAFDNSVEEIRGVLSYAGSLLDSGQASVNDMAITVAGLEGYREYLEDEARILSVPLDFRQGMPVISYGAGRFYRLIQDVVDDSFSFNSMKALLLNRLIPWKQTAEFEALVRFGMDQHCVRNYRRGNGTIDVWEKSLKDNNSALLPVYRKFSGSLRALVGAATFAELKDLLLFFSRDYLDRPRWGDDGDRIIQFCMDVLENLVTAEKDLPGMGIPDPFRIFVSVLGERNYVRRSATAGIPVYDYRVSAGIMPAHHFLLNASQDRTRVSFSPLSFLRDDLRERLGRADRDATKDFLALYRQSGDAVHVSFARTSFEGYQVPPRDFDPAPGLPSEGWTARPYRDERALWCADAGKAPEPSVLLGVQKAGFGRGLRTVLAPKGTDYRHERITDRTVLQAIDAATKTASGLRRVSATTLDEYAACPFELFLSRIMGLEEADTTIQFLDAKTIGILFHQIVADLFLRIQEKDGRFNGDHLDDYRALLRSCIAAATTDMAQTAGAFMRPVVSAYELRVELFLEGFLDEERLRMNGFAIESVERNEKLEDASRQLSYEGRMDRVSSRTGPDGGRCFSVIDYKKGSIDRLKREIRNPEKYTPSFQLPLYVFLLETRGEPVEAAYYYSFEKTGLATVFGPDPGGEPWVTREEFDRLVGSMHDWIDRYTTALRNGDLQEATTRAGCAECALSDICRARFIIR